MSKRFNRRTMVAGAAALTLASRFAPLAAASTPTASIAIPNTPVGAQLAWLLGLFTGAPVHVAAADFAVPVSDAYDSWGAFDTDLKSLARYSSFVVVEVAGVGNSLVAGVSETEISAIGSAFKLYVLGALALAIENGSAAWDEKLAIRDDWKSLPGGEFQNEQAGTEFTLRQFAEKMISISDNTAADHLLLRLGRSSVETATVEMGMANSNHNLPFLTTRELFALKLFAGDATVKEYLDARGYGRLALLPALNALPLDASKAAGWTKPRYIEQIEWFASANDLANATQWLLVKSQEPALSPLRDILSLNPGVQLDSNVWTYVAFKGGSEVGVLTTTWYLTASSKRSYVVSSALNDPDRAIDETTAITAMTKAINLLAKSA